MDIYTKITLRPKLYRLCRNRVLCLLLMIICGLKVIHFSLNISVYHDNEISKTMTEHRRINVEDGCVYHPQYDDVDYNPKVVTEPCENMQIYDNLFIHLHNAIIKTNKLHMLKTGIEQNVQETDEIYGHFTTQVGNVKLHSGFCALQCNFDLDDYTMHELFIQDNVKRWIDGVLVVDQPLVYTTTELVFTVAVQRSDNTNIYVLIREWYNIFIVTYFLQPTVTECKIKVLFVDDWPKSNLDEAWETMFGSIQRIAFIKRPQLYKNLVWIIPKSKSPMGDMGLKIIPLMESFQTFVLHRHGLTITNNNNCKKLNILLVQNKRGYNSDVGFEREIKNVHEIWQEITRIIPEHNTTVVRIEDLSLKNQLSYISQTNILIGMHSTAMTYIMFLPKQAGVIELFPKDTLTTNNRYKIIARWRQLYYISWQNTQPWNDIIKDGSTYIPLNVISFLLRKTVKKICNR